ncbi:hypothetical protein C1O35_05275 [Staphylococcus schleiferi]|uniref:Uncharacterized protein n=1 Tax=Staphylococcus schleiferi TaxID=1295 RepID=A0ABX0FYR4_STASC|nr:hypothetical protein [Staphylococcus schleiferi]NHA38463.1 hypothetical protein [Staphylococcus schleiferi]NHA40683.1 hypothetical protein [Staphylococcus schleiferi]NHA42967.1 hypothetical protein [Staphylococcus schleiferi]
MTIFSAIIMNWKQFEHDDVLKCAINYFESSKKRATHPSKIFATPPYFFIIFNKLNFVTQDKKTPFQFLFNLAII